MSVTHKPNILALNFTHQNKDEKNLVHLVVPPGVLPGTGACPRTPVFGGWQLVGVPVPGAGGWLRLWDLWGGLAVTTCKRKEGQVPVPGSACRATGESAARLGSSVVCARRGHPGVSN